MMQKVQGLIFAIFCLIGGSLAVLGCAVVMFDRIYLVGQMVCFICCGFLGVV